MKRNDPTAPAANVNETLKDARKVMAPPHAPDWDAIDAKLFARIEAEEAADDAARVARLGAASTGRGGHWNIVAGGLAVAAAVALYVGHKPGGAPLDHANAAVAPAPRVVSALVRADGAGEVQVAGARAAAGAQLRVGEALETHGATAIFEREAATPGGPPLVTWSVEDGARVTVGKATGALVVALERGALEAQVTPVPNGEAFAVDVPGADGTVTRVAVHGTHLRVARVQVEGHVRVVVDLSEGVVSIGAPPRAGSTYGTLVTAPAHVELDTGDSSAIRVSHAPADVRAPVALVAASGPVAQAVPQAPGAPAVAPPRPAPASAHAAQPLRPPPVAAKPATADPNAEANVAAAVKACMNGRTKGADEVTVTVSSQLEVRLHDDGAVEFARFSPPLPADAQTCAANFIFKTRFPRAGTVTLDLRF